MTEQEASEIRCGGAQGDERKPEPYLANQLETRHNYSEFVVHAHRERVPMMPETQSIEVLLFDDDQETTKFVESALQGTERLSFHITKVHSTASAIRIFQKILPDVLIASLTSRRNEILALIRKIRSVNTDIPIIAIGARGCEDLALESVKAGAQDCIFRESMDRARILATLQYAIERRKISSDLLRLHMKQISATIEAVTDGILIASADKKILFVNKAAEQFLWVPGSRLIGRKVPLHFEPGQKINETLKLEDGRTIDLEITTTIVPWEDGDAGYCITLHDITDHTRIQNELKSASRLKDEFIAHISHELRTPMNGIIGMTSLLFEHKLPKELRSYIHTIRQSGEAMLDIINDLLDLSKIEAGKIELEENRFNLQKMIEETLDIFAEATSSKNLLLVSHLSQNLPQQILADDSRIRQVLANLVGNAVKFTDTGMVLVEAEAIDHHQIAISIHDTGLGISQKNQKKLFTPFTQLSSDPKRNAGGTGLGLAISQKLTKLLGGKLSCESQLRKGSTFRFTFDYRPVGVKSLPPTKTVTSEKKVQIAILSHDRYFQQQVSQSLLEQNMLPQVLRSFQQLVEPPDVILLDNPKLKTVDEWLPLVKQVRKRFDAPIIIVGRMGLDYDLLHRHRLSSIQRYPLKTSELVAFIIELSRTPDHKGFIFREQERQERITKTFSDLNWSCNRVLVAEDNIINQKVIVAMLEQLGLESDSVSNGQEAVEAAQSFPYDAILMDCRMPILDGYEAAKIIRKISHHYERIPILAVTANALKSERYYDDETLMDAHLPKPITIETLKTTLQIYLGLKDESSEPKMEAIPIIRKQPKGEAMDKLIDKAVLDSLARVGEKVGNNLLAEILQMFTSQSPELLAQLHEAEHQKNCRALSSLAHKLKGSARNIGAQKLAGACNRLEEEAEKESLPTYEPLLNEVAADLDEVLQLLRRDYSHCLDTPSPQEGEHGPLQKAVK